MLPLIQYAKMTELELHEYLLGNYPKESQFCECKEFKNLKHFVKGHEGDDIISYISAISNMEGGHLIVGIEDKTLNIIGIHDFNSYTPENIILKILEQTPNLNSEGFHIESYETSDSKKTIWIIHIPKHQPRKPVLAHNKPWQRIEDCLVRMRPERERAILNEPLSVIEDWSANICPDATIKDLSETAITKARENYKSKFPEQAKEVDQWDNVKFLNKIKLLRQGWITRAAIILLGKQEAESHINPAIAKIRWILKDKDNTEKDYAILSCPLLLSADEVYSKIRKIKYRYMNSGSLFPEEVDQYEPYVIREAINNCIAHQDYSLGGFINVVENEDGFLTFSNLGSFIPGDIEKVIRDDAPEEHYRNPFLAHAMFNLKMVDTIGSGIRRMFNFQRQRFFPMPDYNLENNKVTVKITGKVLDPEYAEVLAQVPNLTLDAIILLDKVQKKLDITPEEIKHLKGKGLIEGRKPNFYISAALAKVTGQKALYSKNKGFNNQYYLDLILKAIKEHQTITRRDIDELITEKLPEVYNPKQKKIKINNLISELRNKGKIQNLGNDRNPIWTSNNE